MVFTYPGSISKSLVSYNTAQYMFHSFYVSDRISVYQGLVQVYRAFGIQLVIAHVQHFDSNHS